MRITYRNKNNKDYWQERWDNVEIDDKMENTGVYPLKYAELTITDGPGKILEAGCGAGRILRYYHDSGHDIAGIDFIETVVSKLKTIEPALQVAWGDITELDFPDHHFRYVLAFGLYHNLETGLGKAFQETARVLQEGGKLCASFRADNLQTVMVDYLASKKAPPVPAADKTFHKLNLKRSEIRQHLKAAGLVPLRIYPVVNMPILYKFAFFRYKTHKAFNENLGRKEGYRLNWMGTLIQNILFKLFKYQFCNLFVVIAQRPAK